MIQKSRAEKKAEQFGKFAQLPAHGRKLCLQAMECLACEQFRECEVGQKFRHGLCGSSPLRACPLKGTDHRPV
ncbi:hypothetical protein C8J31_105129 [Rhizobium sp. PP-CC-2G-626]|nr:hypothetical protein C8J31_105129 [Rhizobium sp. PP-CC-2G-626]